MAGLTKEQRAEKNESERGKYRFTGPGRFYGVIQPGELVTTEVLADMSEEKVAHALKIGVLVAE
ncbi:hypothetical protein N5C79_02220 [Pantoea brenneri]|uniref:hypothetical protein n=1 Tax=Pantoea brenneri TaxID=472694 RepID=UPI00244A75B5|nr:hypothetical protein [Pantoea brenneri]MDH1085305.1 hypothetical protein [Pantoea brenneri]